jgi:hypothetical protein
MMKILVIDSERWVERSRGGGGKGLEERVLEYRVGGLHIFSLGWRGHLLGRTPGFDGLEVVIGEAGLNDGDDLGDNAVLLEIEEVAITHIWLTML